MKLYCQKCGSGTEYSFDRPKFCASCGGSFGHSSISAQAAKQRTVPAPKITRKEEEDDQEVERVPDISKLDFEIDVSQRKGEKIGSLVGTKDPNASEDRSQGAGLTREQVLESFKKEAGFYPARQEINEED